MRNSSVMFAALALSACAQNVVRLEDAGAVSTQASAVTKAVGGYVAGVQTRRREANIALVASDPSCAWGATITTDTEWKPPRGFCDVTGVPAARRATLSLQPLSAEALRPVTLAIAGIATYQAALADVLDKKPIDAKAEIGGTIDLLSTAASDLDRIAGRKLVELGPLTSDRGKAVVDLVGALVELQQTDLKVRKVDAIVQRTDIDALLTALRSAVNQIAGLQDANTAAKLRFALEAAYARETSQLPAPTAPQAVPPSPPPAPMLDFSARRDLVRQIADAADEAGDSGKARLAALDTALDDLAKADKELRDALAGHYPPEKRKRIARDNRKAALGLLTKIAALFPAI